VIIRVMEVPLHSLLGMDFRLFGIFLRAMAHVFLVFGLYFLLLLSYLYTMLFASWCAFLLFEFLLENCKE